MVACARCREAARIAREAVDIAGDLGTLYGIVSGRGATRFTVDNATSDGPIFKSRTSRVVKKKAKRTVTKYQREFGKHLKRLKVKHPRTSASILMKRAHVRTRKAMR